jgi:hypothetical protein
MCGTVSTLINLNSARASWSRTHLQMALGFLVPQGTDCRSRDDALQLFMRQGRTQLQVL